ncbi:MAG: IPTL-CTERM sorting domain-containing protein, partial [Thermodesulfobacteriota bacterium]
LKYYGFPLKDLDSRLGIAGMTLRQAQGGLENRINHSLFSTFSEHYEQLISLPRKIRRAMQRKWKHSLAGVALLLALGASPAMGATTINVNSGNVADLIAAINNANSEVAPFDGEDTIILDGSTFTLTQINNNTDGNNGLPVITSEIIIEGNGSTIQRLTNDQDEFRIFEISNFNGSAELTLLNTIVRGGLANAGGLFGNFGGGIFNFGGTTTITNSTISGNTATGNGGGIFNYGIATITNSTISGNAATGNGGGIYNDGNFALTITNTIVANSANGGDCQNDGTIDDGGNNLIEDPANSCGLNNGVNGNIVGVDPILGVLQNNGGLTPTQALVLGSSAIDTGNDTVCNTPPVNGADQRGISRPQNGDNSGAANCDIGAFEFIDQNNNDIDDCVDTDFFTDIDGDGVSDFCDVLIGDITPAPTLSQWGMIAFGFIAGIFGLGFLRRKKGLVVRD